MYRFDSAKISNRIRANAVKQLDRAALDVQQEMKRLLGKRGTARPAGRLYARTKKARKAASGRWGELTRKAALSFVAAKTAANHRLRLRKGIIGATRMASLRSSGVHQASAPGQPPAVDTGALRRSIQINRKEVRSNYRIKIGTNLNYGKFLEFGTRGKKKGIIAKVMRALSGGRLGRGGQVIAPRPWAFRSLDNVRDKVKSRLTREKLLVGVGAKGKGLF